MSKHDVITALIRVRMRDWERFHRWKGTPKTIDEDRRAEVIRQVTECFTEGIFASDASDPSSDLSLSLIEGEIETRLGDEKMLVALACCRHAGLVPRRGYLTVEFTGRDGGNVWSQTPIIDIGKSFAFGVIFEYANPESVVLTDDAHSLLKVAATELPTPEAKFAFTFESMQNPPLTEYLPSGWGLNGG